LNGIVKAGCLPQSSSFSGNTTPFSYTELNHSSSQVLRLDENCARLGYDAVTSGDSLPTFRDSLSVPSSRIKNPRSHYLYSLRTSPEEHSSHLLRGGSFKSHRY